ncbi:MAG: hypothetical protein KDJ80_13420 [Nitratireductor sp.]|nr:hypothetical protein [Nitratireductor sp.]
MARALQLILHTIRLIFGNLKQALQVSLGGFLLAAGAIFLFVLIVSQFQMGPAGPGGSGTGLVVALFGFALALFLVLVFCAVAIAWHRYILLNEVPRGLFPISINGLAVSYLTRVAGISLLLIVLSVAAMTLINFAIVPLLSAIAGADNGFAGIVLSFATTLAIMVLVQYVAMRLFVSLPAIAVENTGFSIGDAWAASGRERGAIFWILVIMTIAVWGTILLVTLPFVPSGPPIAAQPPLIVSVLLIPIQWFYFMFNICILTTLYGITVEGREI